MVKQNAGTRFEINVDEVVYLSGGKHINRCSVRSGIGLITSKQQKGSSLLRDLPIYVGEQQIFGTQKAKYHTMSMIEVKTKED
jgi:hypothetical protein